MEDPLTTTQDQVRAAVVRALSTRPDGAAGLSEVALANGVWGLDLNPRHPAAAAVSLAMASDDELTVSFGQTHAYLDADAALPTRLEHILEAVMAGRFVERGPRNDARARLTLADGSTWSCGSIGAWWWPLRRTYAAYL